MNTSDIEKVTYARAVKNKAARFIYDYYYSDMKVNGVWTNSYYRGSTTYVRIGPVLISSSRQYEKDAPSFNVMSPADAVLVPLTGNSTYNRGEPYKAPEDFKLTPLQDNDDGKIWAFIDKRLDAAILELETKINARNARKKEEKERERLRKKEIRENAIREALDFIDKNETK